MSDAASVALARARHFLAIDRPERALGAIEASAQGLAQDPDAWVIRVASLLELDRHAEAMRAARAGLGIHPNQPMLLGLAGLAARHLGDLAGAERYLLQGLSIDPEDAWLLSRYAEIVALAGQIPKANALIERAAALSPESRTVLRARYTVANLRGDDAETRRIASALAASGPDDADALALVGIERLHQDDLSGAGRALSAAASLDIRTVEAALPAYAELRLRTHPLLWPMRFTDRLGQVTTWAVAVGILLGGNALSRQLGDPPGLQQALGLFGWCWILFCIYSWVAPPLLRRWLVRRRRVT